MIQQPTLPLQQAAVQQQLQQNPQACVQPKDTYNAINISINGASVNAPSQHPVVPVQQPEQVIQPEPNTQNINYLA